MSPPDPEQRKKMPSGQSGCWVFSYAFGNAIFSVACKLCCASVIMSLLCSNDLWLQFFFLSFQRPVEMLALRWLKPSGVNRTMSWCSPVIETAVQSGSHLCFLHSLNKTRNVAKVFLILQYFNEMVWVVYWLSCPPLFALEWWKNSFLKPYRHLAEEEIVASEMYFTKCVFIAVPTNKYFSLHFMAIYLLL